MQWSNSSRLKGAEVFTKVLGESREGLYLLRYRNRFYTRGIIIEKYSHLLELESSQSIELRKARLLKLYLTPQGLVLIKAVHDRKKQVNRLVAQRYSHDLEKDGEAKILVTKPIREFGDRGDFRIRISDNMDYIAVLYSAVNDDSLSVVRELYATTLVPLQKNSYKWIGDEPLQLTDIKLTNDKKTYLLSESVEQVSRRRFVKNYELVMLQDTSIQRRKLGDSVALHSPSLVYSRAIDAVSLVSFFKDKEEYGLMGVCYYRWKDSVSQGAYTMNRFSEMVYEQLRISENKEGQISEGFELLQAIPRSDGGVLLVAEQKEVATEDDIIMVNGLPQTTSKNIYNFNEILVLNYDDSAFLDWHKLITKNQTTVNDAGYFSSVVIYVGPQYVQLLYNDQLRSSGDVVQYTIYNNGKEESRKLLKAELDYIAIVPSEARQVSSNKVVIPTSKNRRFALLKLIYP